MGIISFLIKGIYIIFFINISKSHCSTFKNEILKNVANKNETVNVSGYVKIAGKMFRATCNCPSHIKTLEDMVYRSQTLCRPSKIKVRTHNVPEGPDPQIIAHFKYLPLNDFVYISEQHFASMDGRSNQNSFFCPGGDLGMFIEVLMNMFEATERLSESVITELMKEYLKSLPNDTKFYHSTDQASLDGIRKSLEWDVIDLHNINFVNQNKVKNLLLQNLGDYYLKYLFELYRNNTTKNRILIWTLWSYFNILWDKSDEVNEKLQLDVLSGPYNPQLLLCEVYQTFPKVDTRIGDRQLLIFSEYAAHLRKTQISTFVFKYFNNLNYNFNLTLDQYIIQLNKNGYILMENFSKFQPFHLSSVMKYANKLPFYNITYV